MRFPLVRRFCGFHGAAVADGLLGLSLVLAGSSAIEDPPIGIEGNTAQVITLIDVNVVGRQEWLTYRE